MQPPPRRILANKCLEQSASYKPLHIKCVRCKGSGTSVWKEFKRQLSYNINDAKIPDSDRFLILNYMLPECDFCVGSGIPTVPITEL